MRGVSIPIGVPGHPSRFRNAWTGPFELALTGRLEDALGPVHTQVASIAKVERQSTLGSTHGLTPTSARWQTLDT